MHWVTREVIYHSVTVHTLPQVWQSEAGSDFRVETLVGSYHFTHKSRGRRERALLTWGVSGRGFQPTSFVWNTLGAFEQKLATVRAGLRSNINLLVIIRQMVSSLLHPVCTTQSCCTKDEYSVALEFLGWACEWGKMVSCFVETLLCSPQRYSLRGNDFPSPVRLRHHFVSVWDNCSNVSKRRGKLWIWLWKGKGEGTHFWQAEPWYLGRRYLSPFFLIFHGSSTWQHISDLSGICGLNTPNFVFYIGSQYIWMKNSSII